MKKYALVGFGGLVILFIAARLPQTTVVSQSITMQFVNGVGGPISGIRVRQNWEFYGIEGRYYADAVSDSEGKILFPERSITSSLGEKFMGRVFSVVNIHGSYGPSVLLDVQTPTDSEIAFEASGLSKLEPFVTSGSYIDGYRRIFSPRESETSQSLFIRGDFNIGDTKIRIVLKERANKPSQPMPSVRG